MKRIITAAVLLLGLGIMTVSCTKTNPSSSISGTWAKLMKSTIVENPSEALSFVNNTAYVVFSGNTASFMSEDNKVVGKGSFTYSVSETTEEIYGTIYRGTISFSGLPIKGGEFTRTKFKDGYSIQAMADSIDWTDIVEGLQMHLQYLP